MKKFAYKMENILEIKYQLEEQAKTSYGNARNALSKEEKKLDSLKKQQSEFYSELTDLIRSKIDLVKVNKYKEAINTYKTYIKQQENKVAIAKQKVESARQKLQEAMVERKTHEKLKEKALEDYILEYEEEQQKEIDEITSYRYTNLVQSKEGLNAG